MVIVTLTVDAFAALLQGFHCIVLPVAVGGFVYAVKEGGTDPTIYRVAVA